MIRAELVFGRNIGTALGVSEADFHRFLSEEVTSRFPDGFTVLDSKGQYRDQAGRIIREPGKVVVIAFPDGQTARDKIAAIAAGYKDRFRQEAVATVLTGSCVTF